MYQLRQKASLLNAGFQSRLVLLNLEISTTQYFHSFPAFHSAKIKYKVNKIAFSLPDNNQHLFLSVSVPEFERSHSYE